MVHGIEGVLLFSKNPRKLADFYTNVVGLPEAMEIAMGEKEEAGFVFTLEEGGNFAILHHDKVTGVNKQPERLLINFEVDDIEKEAGRMKDEGAKLVQEVYHVEDYGFIATFADVDGNYFQLVKTRD